MLIVDTPTKEDVGEDSVMLSCSASGWSLDTSDIGTPDEPSSEETGTSATTTADAIEYKDLKYHWHLGTSTTVVTTDNFLDRRVNGLPSGQEVTVTIELEVTETKLTYTVNQKWTRSKKKDSEGKETSEYEDWSKSGSTYKTNETSTSIDLGSESEDCIVYTRPAGSFTAWSGLAGKQIDVYLTAADQRDWYDRCLAIKCWYDQDNSATMSSWKVSSGDSVSAALYNAMASDCGDWASVSRVVQNTTTIRASHWLALQNAVNNYST